MHGRGRHRHAASRQARSLTAGLAESMPLWLARFNSFMIWEFRVEEVCLLSF